MQYISEFLTTQPEIIWLISFMGAVAVVGLVNFLKCFIPGKKAIKWIVLVVSLAVAFVLGPLTPPVITTIVMFWLLILAIATIAWDVIKAGISTLTGGVINKLSGKIEGKGSGGRR